MISSEKINTQRQFEIDMIKSFAIIWMAIIHIYEEWSTQPDKLASTFIENFIQFMSGPLAAPVFIFAMGIGLIYSPKNSPKKIFTRGLILFVLSYVFNLLRSGLPYIIIDELIRQNHNESKLIFNLLNIDILQFAGLSLMLTGLLKKLNIKLQYITIIAIIMQIVGIILQNIIVTNEYSQYIFGLFFFCDYGTCFPILTWYIYVVIGMIFGTILQHITDKNTFYRYLLIFSISLLTLLSISLFFIKYDFRYIYDLYEDIYYQLDGIKVSFVLLAIFVEISIFYFLHIFIKNQIIESFIKYTSKHLTQIYVIHWFLIEIPNIIFHFNISNIWIVIIDGILIYISSILISFIIQKIKQKKQNII